MISLANLSIRKKLMMIAIVAIVTAFLLLFTFESHQQRQLIRSGLVYAIQTQAKMISATSIAAIVFDDPKEGRKVLQAFEESPNVIMARIVLPNGQTFAEYRQPGEKIRSEDVFIESSQGFQFIDDELLVWEPIVVNDTELGIIKVWLHMDYYQQRIERTNTLSAIFMLVIALVALIAIHFLARRITSPIERLSKLSETITDSAHLDARADINSRDEVGKLATAMNRMLDRLQRRDRELTIYRDKLEEKVEARTQELHAATVDAHKANKAKSDFLARMSHEIRTPMNAIMGFTRQVLRSDLNTTQRSHMEKVLSASDSLLRIINDILDYSKIEAGKLPLDLLPFSIEETVIAATDVGAVAAQDKGIELIIDIHPDTPRRFVGDAYRLRQILSNLINNAVKFTDKGEVVVRAWPARNDHSDDDAAAMRMHIQICDTGVGLDLSGDTELFAPFNQMDGSITRRYGGTGLGLAICKQLVELMDGQIWYDPNPQGGTCFSVELPLRFDADRQSLSEQIPQYPTLSVLLVDDNDVSRNHTQILLRSMGINTDAVCGGFEALKRLADQDSSGGRYDLIIMDWQMPEMDGVATARKLQHQSSLTTIPILMMVTSLPSDSFNESVHAFGIERTLAKPFTTSMLAEGIASVLNRSTDYIAELSLSMEQRRQKLLALNGAHVLLVEDNKLNQEVALAFLDEYPITVDTANDGIEAMEKIKSTHYDAILMDIQMPRLDGLTATRRIREMPDYADIPIIAMTAHAMVGDREASLDAGMNDHLIKPIDPDELFRVLNYWITQSLSSNGEAQPKKTVSNVLVVDDSEMSRRAMHSLIEMIGATSHEAEDGESAIQLLKQQSFDLAFIDIQLPGMNGPELLKCIRQIDGYNTLPAAAFSTNISDEERSRYFENGFNWVLDKPIDVSTLAKVIHQARIGESSRVGDTANTSFLAWKPTQIDPRIGLANHMDRASLYYRILQIFLNDYRHAAPDIERLCHDANFDDARRLAHSIKSGAATIGAETLAEIAMQLENELTGHRLNDDTLMRFTHNLEAVCEDILELDTSQKTEHVIPDQSSLIQLIAELNELLINDDAAAEDCIEKMERHIAAEQQQIFEALAAAVNEIEYERALTLLQRMCNELPGCKTDDTP